MNKISILTMKIVRRVINRFSNWYYTTSFIAGLENYEEGIHVYGQVNLWNDHVSVRSQAHIYQGVTLWGPGKIKIGKNVALGINSVVFHLKMWKSVIILY